MCVPVAIRCDRLVIVEHRAPSQSLISELVTEFKELDMDAENTAASTSPRKPGS